MSKIPKGKYCAYKSFDSWCCDLRALEYPVCDKYNKRLKYTLIGKYPDRRYNIVYKCSTCLKSSKGGKNE